MLYNCGGMEPKEGSLPGNAHQPQLPSALEDSSLPTEELRRQRQALVLVSFLGLVILTGFVVAIIYLLQPSSPTTTIRDIFIILMALEFMVIGVALIILVIQLARLVNLLQNEVKPILDSTNEAASTLRGTATFLSDNLIEPVMKLNQAMAVARRILDLTKLGRK